MKETNYTVNDQKISYEVTATGYKIYLGGKIWITQDESGYIPYRDKDPNADLETCCVKHIEEIVEGFNKAAEDAEEAPVEG